eukprot:6695036-Lingulodinium_polyedra.AAC.1
MILYHFSFAVRAVQWRTLCVLCSIHRPDGLATAECLRDVIPEHGPCHCDHPQGAAVAPGA